MNYLVSWEVGEHNLLVVCEGPMGQVGVSVEATVCSITRSLIRESLMPTAGYLFRNSCLLLVPHIPLAHAHT